MSIAVAMIRPHVTSGHADCAAALQWRERVVLGSGVTAVGELWQPDSAVPPLQVRCRPPDAAAMEACDVGVWLLQEGPRP